MSKHVDVLILGGGVIGLTTAYFLAKEGVSVEVLDRVGLGAEASWAGAGIIPPGNPDLARHPYDQLRALGTQMHAVLSAELFETTSIDNGYRQCGGIEFFEEDASTIVDAWRQEAIEFTPLTRDECRESQPGMETGALLAYFLPGMAQVRNPWHLRALIAACTNSGDRGTGRLGDRGSGGQGVRLRPDTPLAKIHLANSSITSIELADGNRMSARAYLFAAGAWTDELLASLGCKLGVAPVRGQIALLRAPEAGLKRILLAGKRYIVPREDGRILIGSTEEPEAGFRKETTPEGIAELLAFGSQLVPALAGVQLERTWAGLRPGSPDGLPFLGRVPGYRNAFVATGHFRSGIQLSPSTALVMTDLIQGRTPRISIESLRPDRPALEAFVPAFRS